MAQISQPVLQVVVIIVIVYPDILYPVFYTVVQDFSQQGSIRFFDTNFPVKS